MLCSAYGLGLIDHNLVLQEKLRRMVEEHSSNNLSRIDPEYTSSTPSPACEDPKQQPQQHQDQRSPCPNLPPPLPPDKPKVAPPPLPPETAVVENNLNHLDADQKNNENERKYTSSVFCI